MAQGNDFQYQTTNQPGGGIFMNSLAEAETAAQEECNAGAGARAAELVNGVWNITFECGNTGPLPVMTAAPEA